MAGHELYLLQRKDPVKNLDLPCAYLKAVGRKWITHNSAVHHGSFRVPDAGIQIRFSANWKASRRQPIKNEEFRCAVILAGPLHR